MWSLCAYVIKGKYKKVNDTQNLHYILIDEYTYQYLAIVFSLDCCGVSKLICSPDSIPKPFFSKSQSWTQIQAPHYQGGEI